MWQKEKKRIDLNLSAQNSLDNSSIQLNNFNSAVFRTIYYTIIGPILFSVYGKGTKRLLKCIKFACYFFT